MLVLMKKNKTISRDKLGTVFPFNLEQKRLRMKPLTLVWAGVDRFCTVIIYLINNKEHFCVRTQKLASLMFYTTRNKKTNNYFQALPL